MSDLPENAFTMRVVGAITLVASIVQIGVAGSSYGMTSWKVGAWWAGLSAFIASIFALISNSKGIVGAGCAFSIISVILIVVGIILDGIWYGVTNSLDTCYDRDSNQFYGSSSYKSLAASCAYGHSQTCLCVNGANEDTCYLFNLESADNCGEILTTMPALLLVSLLFLLGMFVTMLTYSILTCKNTCCAKRDETAALNAQPTPAVAQAVPAVPMSNKV